MKPFSDDLETWLHSKQPKTLASLIDISEDKSFAVIIFFLMLLPALPIPTAGVSHIFEIITILLGLEMFVGLRKVWLPQRVGHVKLTLMTRSKGMHSVIKRIRWLEAHSTPRGRYIFKIPLFDRFTGLLLASLALAALLSPPFSGLDTIPSVCAVIICLAVILDDALMFLGGLLVSVAGVVAVFTLGAAVVEAAKQLF